MGPARSITCCYRVPTVFVYILPTTCLDASALPTRRPARVFMPAMRTPFTVATASVSSIAPPVSIDCCPTANLRTLDLALLDISFVRFPLSRLGLGTVHPMPSICHGFLASLSNTSVDRHDPLGPRASISDETPDRQHSRSPHVLSSLSCLVDLMSHSCAGPEYCLHFDKTNTLLLSTLFILLGASWSSCHLHTGT